MTSEPRGTTWLTAVLGVITAVVVLEFTVRADDWAQFGTPFFSPAVSIGELAVQDSLGFHARPGAHFRQFRINAQGFRGPPVDLARVRGTLVIASGASETFGLYERAGGDWPRQLEDSLARCTPKVQVLNAAFAGMSLPTVRQDFELRLSPLKPDVVVYYPTPMQYLYAEPPRPAPRSLQPPAPLSPWRSRALPRFRDAIKRSTPQPVLRLFRQVETRKARASYGITAKPRVETARLDTFERDLRGLVGSYRRQGVVPVLVVHAHRFTEYESKDAQVWLEAWERFYPSYTGRAIAEYDNQAAERIRRVASDSGIVVVDPRPALRALGTRGFADYSHFTDAGAGVVAGATAKALAPRICQTTE